MRRQGSEGHLTHLTISDLTPTLSSAALSTLPHLVSRHLQSAVGECFIFLYKYHVLEDISPQQNVSIKKHTIKEIRASI